MQPYIPDCVFVCVSGEVFDYLVAHGRMKEKEARAKFRQVRDTVIHVMRNFFGHALRTANKVTHALVTLLAVLDHATTIVNV